MIELRWLDRNIAPPFEGNRVLQFRVIERTELTYDANGYVNGHIPHWSDWQNVPIVKESPKMLVPDGTLVIDAGGDSGY
jgi:hypothetical protein